MRLPPLVWKQIAGVKISRNDLKDIDVLWCNKMEMIGKAEMNMQDGKGVRSLTREEFETVLDPSWTVSVG